MGAGTAPQEAKRIVYMLANTPDSYRWVGPVEDTDNWGRRLIAVRMDPVAATWHPVPVEWVPETAARAIADFPQFWSGMLCVSKGGVAALAGLLDDAGEFLALTGLNDEYIAWHCLRTVDAMDRQASDDAIKAAKGISFHSPTFVPTLRTDRVPPETGVFRIPESFQKVFVRQQFVDNYRDAGLTGLDFLPVL